MPCNNYPMCEHDPGDCPDPFTNLNKYWPHSCAECGGIIRRGSEEPYIPTLHRSCSEKKTDYWDQVKS